MQAAAVSVETVAKLVDGGSAGADDVLAVPDPRQGKPMARPVVEPVPPAGREVRHDAGRPRVQPAGMGTVAQLCRLGPQPIADSLILRREPAEVAGQSLRV